MYGFTNIKIDDRCVCVCVCLFSLAVRKIQVYATNKNVMKRGKRRHLNLITKVRCSQSPIRLHFYSISYIIQIILICFQAFYFSPLGTYRWECRILPVTSMESPSNFSVLISVSQGIRNLKTAFPKLLQNIN